MTAKALQRVVVRMLYDPALVEAVYADPQAALADVALTAAERTWLVAPDRRRWRADPMRRARGLQALLEEYPVASAVLARRAGVSALDAFFSSSVFHGCIQERRSLAATFGHWLAAHGIPLLSGLADIESAVVAVRRAEQPLIDGDGGAGYTLAPTVAVRRLPRGSLAAFADIQARLARHPQGGLAGVVDLEFAIGRHDVAIDSEEGLIVEGGPQMALGEAPMSLINVLDAARTPLTADALAAIFLAEGAEPHDVNDLISDLVADGLLVFRPGRGPENR